MTEKEVINNTAMDSQETQGNPNKIDAIKELIFGSNIKEYANEFKEIKQLIDSNKEEQSYQLEQTKNDLVDLIDDLKKDLNRQLDELHLSMTREIDRLEEQKTDRSLLVNLFSDMAKKIEG